MIQSALLGVVAVVMFGPVGIWLSRSRWPERAPRAAVALWQAVGVSGALSAVGAGLCLAVAPLHRAVIPGVAALFGRAAVSRQLPVNGLAEACGLTLAAIAVAVLVSGLVVTTIGTVSMRRQHRILLDLVAVRAEHLHGAVMLQDPRATAYCLPGVRPRIVVSDGATRMLSPSELGAVVDHEKGHLHEHHDLALLPFASLREMLSWIPYTSRAPRSVALLLELAADDYAARHHDPRILASTLVQMADPSGVPACAFGTSSHVAVRVNRLVSGQSNSAAVASAGLFVASILAIAPLLIIGAG